MNRVAIIKRSAIGFGLFVGLLLLGVLLFSWWLFHSEAGAGWLLNRAQATLPGLQVGERQGRLADDLRLQNVVWQQPGTRVQLKTANLKLDLDWLPLSLNIRSLSADQLVVHLEPAAAPAAAEQTGLPNLASPIPIKLKQLTVTDITVHNGSSRQRIEQIQAAAVWSDDLTVNRLQVRHPTATLSLSGSASLEPPYRHELSSQGVLNPDNPWLALTEPLAVEWQSDGSLNELQTIIALSGAIDAQISGQGHELAQRAQWQFDLSSPEVFWPLNDPAQRNTVHSLSVQLSGEGRRYTFELAGDIAGADLPVGHLQADGRGDANGLTIEQLRFNGDELETMAGGSIGFGGNGGGTLQLGRFNPSRWLPDWPADQLVAGSLRWEQNGGRFGLPEFHLSLPGGKTSISGSLQQDSAGLSIAIDWQGLQWPLSPDALTENRVSSPQGRIEITGTLDDYRVQGRLTLDAVDQPSAAVMLTGHGNQQQFDLQELRGSWPDGQLAAGGTVHWPTETGPLEWSVHIDGQQINPGFIHPAYPGKLDFNLIGESHPSGLQLRIDHLSGQLRDRPVSGTGAVNLIDGIWHIEGLRLAAGDAYLEAQGQIGEDRQLTWKAEISALQELLPGTRGSIQADGAVGRKNQALNFSINGNAENLLLADFRVDALQIDADGLLADKPELNAVIDGTGGYWRERSWGALNLSIDGAGDQFKLSGHLQAPIAVLDMALKGRLQNWQNPDQRRWTGEIDDFTLQLADQPVIRLQRPAALRLGMQAIELDAFCLTQTNAPQTDTAQTGGMALCTDFQRDAAHTALAADLKALPLQILAQLGAMDARMDQLLSGELRWQQPANAAPTASGAFELTPGQWQTDGSQPVPTGPGRFSFQLQDGHLLAGEASITVGDNNPIDGSWTVSDISRGLDSTVSGDLQLELLDAKVLRRLVPEIDQASGSLLLTSHFSGTLAKPVIEGELKLVDMALFYAPLGLNLREINIDSRLAADQRIELGGSLKGGDGLASLSGSAQLANYRPRSAALEVRGEHIQIADTPNLKLRASPDFQLDWRDGTIGIDGGIHIPFARLQPPAAEAAAVPPSEDMVVIGEDRQGSDEKTAGRTKINGQLQVSLGDDVRFAAAGAETAIGGQLDLSWAEAAMLPIANGMLNVSGHYQAYGQNLEIKDGRIRFANVPADNPALSIEAVRQIFGDPTVNVAGVRIGGNASQPKITLFTDPATSEEKALAYVLTGSDFDHGNGVGALNLGFYLLPQLFVSYGIGLFDNGNVISARYDLTRRWGLKAQSGERDTGVDLLYSIER